MKFDQMDDWDLLTVLLGGLILAVRHETSTMDGMSATKPMSPPDALNLAESYVSMAKLRYDK
jgi:hypothetical protein